MLLYVGPVCFELAGYSTIPLTGGVVGCAGVIHIKNLSCKIVYRNDALSRVLVKTVMDKTAFEALCVEPGKAVGVTTGKYLI